MDKIFVVRHFWGCDGDEPTEYYVRSKHWPNKKEVVKKLKIDYQPEKGEDVFIHELEIVDLGTFELHTIGDGWSLFAKSVKITDVYLNYFSNDDQSGELHVSFEKSSWDVFQCDLIYQDTLFLKELKSHFDIEEGIGYSEQGMQGKDFVSFDVGPKFLNSEFGKTLIQRYESKDLK